VFSSPEDLARRLDDPNLDICADDFMVLQNAGPTSGACMPEAGYLPIPRKLSAQGVKDLVRISDARMSGTAYGTVILHVSPDASSGGPLGLVRSGDRIRLSVRERRIDLLVDETELRKRSHAKPQLPARGYGRLYHQQVLQAEYGCDFDFLRRSPTRP
jgi:dihydroxy-acid dehydratase